MAKSESGDFMADYEASVQRRRHEAYNCRKMGFISMGVGLILFLVGTIMNTVFGIPGTDPVFAWVGVPMCLTWIFGAGAVAVGAMEAY